MKRTVFLVEKICLAEEYESTSKVATTYIGAINIFKTFIVDTLVFNAIWDMHIDNEVPTGENLLLYGGGKDSTYRMFTRCGKPIYEFPLEEYFLNKLLPEYCHCQHSVHSRKHQRIYHFQSIDNSLFPPNCQVITLRICSLLRVITRNSYSGIFFSPITIHRVVLIDISVIVNNSYTWNKGY